VSPYALSSVCAYVYVLDELCVPGIHVYVYTCIPCLAHLPQTRFEGHVDDVIRRGQIENPGVELKKRLFCC